MSAIGLILILFDFLYANLQPRWADLGILFAVYPRRPPRREGNRSSKAKNRPYYCTPLFAFSHAAIVIGPVAKQPEAAALGL